ncbi:MAG: glycosyltransferase family 39 protein [Candidatus Moraniibacteriota bacterium]
MHQLLQFVKRHPVIILSLMLAVFLGFTLRTAWTDSATYDERAHIPASYSSVRYGDMRINYEHPPLLKDLVGLSLLTLNPTFPITDPLWTEGVNEQWNIGTLFLYGPLNNADLLIFLARLPIILLSLLAAYFLYRMTRESVGTLAGIFAVLLFAFNPNIIAHAHLVTTDLGIATAILIATYFFIRFLKHPSTRNLIIAGIILGLAQTVKFSAILILPIFGIMSVLYGIGTAIKLPWIERWKLAFAYARKYIYILLICFITVYTVYLPNVWNMPGEQMNALAEQKFNDDREAKVFARNVIANMEQIPVLKPFTHYTLGVMVVFTRVAGGNVFFFNNPFFNDSSRDLISTVASPWYFPAVFLMKETIPFLFLLFFSILYSLYHIARLPLWRETASHGLQSILASFHTKVTEWAIGLFIALYVLLSVTGNLNIGLRHLFPIILFLSFFIAKTLAQFVKRQTRNEEHLAPEYQLNRRILSIIGFGFSVWIIAIPFIAYPNFLSYFNEAIGSKNGYHYVTDSNYDWGQDMKRVKEFVDKYNQCVGQLTKSPACRTLIGASRNDITLRYPSGFEKINTIRVDYFGGAEPSYYLGNAFKPWYGGLPPEAGWYALSTFFIQEDSYKTIEPGTPSYRDWLWKFRPVARAGESILIYYLTEEDIDSLRH